MIVADLPEAHLLRHSDALAAAFVRLRTLRALLGPPLAARTEAQSCGAKLFSEVQHSLNPPPLSHLATASVRTRSQRAHAREVLWL